MNEGAKMDALKAALVFLQAFVLGRAAAAFENLALRQQLVCPSTDFCESQFRAESSGWVVHRGRCT